MLNPLNHPICLLKPRRLTFLSFWHEHIPFAMFLVDLLKPEIIVELGTQGGDSYCAFCQAVKELNLNTRCFAVDTWQGDPHTGPYSTEVLADLRAHHDPLYGAYSCLIPSTFDEALKHFENGTIDLLHIDGYHTYETVGHDFEAWLPKLSEKGVILFHDINVRERNYGVWKLWGELKTQYPHFEFLHGYGLGVLGAGKNQSKKVQEFFNMPAEDAIAIQKLFFELGQRLTLEVTQKKLTTEYTRQLAEKDRLLTETNRQLTEKNRLLAERDQQLADRDRQLTEKDRQLQALLNSRSWRITAPLRALYQKLKK